MAGYSGTPLVKKLGIRLNVQIAALHAPPHYAALLDQLPDGVSVGDRLFKKAKFVHLFATRRAALEKELATVRDALDDAGMLWVSWPKKAAAKVDTDITEDTIRELALPLGFVDVKVCAIDETWSALKLMVRREHRRSAVNQSRPADSKLRPTAGP